MLQRIKDKIRAKILTIKVKDLYSTIDEDDILKKDKVGYTYKGKTLNENEIKRLANEAKIIKETKLWEILQNDIKYRANQKMYEKSQDIMDLTAGKLWLYTIDCINTKLEDLIKNDR